MSVVLAVNIGYSPRHAVAQPGTEPPRHRVRRAMAIASVLALLAAGAGYLVFRTLRLPAQRTASGPVVHIYPATELGLREPADLIGAGGHLWITSSGGNSVTELGWRHAGHPVVRAGDSYG